jgi:hypothetical protein
MGAPRLGVCNDWSNHTSWRSATADAVRRNIGGTLTRPREPLDLSDMTIETPQTVAARIRRALPCVPPERIVVAPDCGLKYLLRGIAYGKLRIWLRVQR